MIQYGIYFKCNRMGVEQMEKIPIYLQYENV